MKVFSMSQRIYYKDLESDAESIIKKDKIKTFQFELIRLIQEAGGLKKPEEKNRLYKNHPKGFYVYAKFKSTDNDSNDASYNKK